MTPTQERVLIMVRAIPEETKSHGTTVCVAGINTKYEWRRLYPIPFLKALSFHKRSVLEVKVETPNKDKRDESRKVLQFHLARKEQIPDDKVKAILQQVKNKSIAELEANNRSLGVITPQIIDMKVEVHSTEITDPQLKMLWNKGEFGVGQEELKKLPVTASYIFKCPDPSSCSCSNKPHEIKIIDWEVNELFRHLVKKKENTPQMIADKIKQRFFTWMTTERDLYLILGTHNLFKTWIVIGVFYPKKVF